MNPVWYVLAPLLALAVVVATMQLFVALAGAIRFRDYQRFENWSAKKIRKEFPLPGTASTAGEDRRAAFAPLLAEMHQSANRAQTAYHDAVVRSAACLALGFAAMAGGTLATDDWPGMFRLQALPWQFFLGCVDTVALIFVLVLFLHGTVRYRPWIAKRAETELVRQYQYLSVLLPEAFPVSGKDETRAGHPGKAAAKDRHFGRLVERIEKSWHERKARIEHLAPGQPHLDRDTLILYLRKRVLRQLGWFTDSTARLEHIANRRKNLLLVLYIATAILAPVQLGCLLAHAPLPLIRPLLLLITGLSLAMTAYYTNQNLGSIVHRYYVQQRDIRRWSRGLVSRINDGNTSHTLDDPATMTLICTHVAAFEELMIYELIDWINISAHDVIELG